MNPMGIYLNQRNYFTSHNSGWLTNVNRVFPGTAAVDGGSGPELLAYNIWNNVWANKSQVDVGIDLRKVDLSDTLRDSLTRLQIPRVPVARPRFGATPTFDSHMSSA